MGLPSAGGGREFTDWYGEIDAATKLRRDLNISKDEFDVVKLQDMLVVGNDDELSIRCFFLILFNRLLFPSASWGITNNEFLMTTNMDHMALAQEEHNKHNCNSLWMLPHHSCKLLSD